VKFIAFLLFCSSVAFGQAPTPAQKPLHKDQVMALVAAGMDSAQLAKRVEERGIDFEPTDDYIEALRKAGAQDVLIQALRPAKAAPMNQQQVLQLMAGGVPVERATALVKQRGIDFVPTDDYLETLRVAGADETLIAAVRDAANAIRGKLQLSTAPNAEVYLDGALAGKTDSGGSLTLDKVKSGAHAVRVTAAAKKPFEQSVTVSAGATSKLSAALADLPGKIVVNSKPGAEVFLDNVSRGKTDSSGKLVIADVAPGNHVMRVTAPGKYDWNGGAPASAGQDTQIQVQLQGSNGGLRLRAAPGAKVYFGDKCSSVVKSGGEITWPGISAGSYALRVVAPGEAAILRNVTVTEGNETTVDARGSGAAKPIGRGIDGLYESAGADGWTSWVRFFADGSVTAFAYGPAAHATPAKAESTAQESKSQGDVFPYRMQGSTILFSTWGWGVIDYVAKAHGNTLRLSSADCDSRNYKETIYTLVSR
jgi:hypothetical protein